MAAAGLPASLVLLANANTLGDVLAAGVTGPEATAALALDAPTVVRSLTAAGVSQQKLQYPSFLLRMAVLGKRIPVEALSTPVEDADYQQLARDQDAAERKELLAAGFTEEEMAVGGGGSTGGETVVRMGAGSAPTAATTTPYSALSKDKLVYAASALVPLMTQPRNAATTPTAGAFAAFTAAAPVDGTAGGAVSPTPAPAATQNAAPSVVDGTPGQQVPPAAATAPAAPLGPQIGTLPDGSKFTYTPVDFFALQDLLACVMGVLDDPVFGAKIAQGPLAGKSAQVVATMIQYAMEHALVGPKGVAGVKLKEVADAGFNNRKWKAFCLRLLNTPVDATMPRPTTADMLTGRHPNCEMLASYEQLWPYCDDKLRAAQDGVSDARKVQLAELQLAAEIKKMTAKA